MTASLASTASSIGQLIAVLLIFAFVLFITAWVTRWIASYQKEKTVGDNVEILETKRIAPNKLIEIVRIGNRYFALAIGKDETNLISEIEKDSLSFDADRKNSFSFRDFLEKARDNGEEVNK